ncbi:MAG: DUF3343 domain-containing protein [Clostridiales bacterium]|nr:DUF3343 domain-containing protein [Candidatus Cacconaster stercorequi]
MIERKLRLLVTFHTTAGAMAMEKRCKAQGVPGRLIPVPRSITADCGMAWRAELEQRRALETITADLDVDSFYELIC